MPQGGLPDTAAKCLLLRDGCVNQLWALRNRDGIVTQTKEASMIRAVDFAGQSCCLTLWISSALGAVPISDESSSSAPTSLLAVPQSSIEKTLPRMDKDHPLKIGAPYYPPESKRLGERGMCLVRVEIDADGVIRATQLISATGFGRLDSACLTAVMNGQLRPATAEGKPVFSWLEIPIYWTLGKPPSRPHFDNLFLIPTIRSDYQLKIGPDNYPPESRQKRQEGDCAVHGYVKEDGSANNVSISKSTGFAALDQACIAAIQQAPFLPAHASGAAIGAFVDINISWRLSTK